MAAEPRKTAARKAESPAGEAGIAEGQGDPGTPLPLTRNIERWALTALLLAVPLALATGLSRYEVLKLALLAGLGGIGLVAFAVDFCQGRHGRRLGGGLAVAVAWLLVLTAALSLLWAPSMPGAAMGMLRWLLLLGVFALVAARPSGWGWVTWPLVISGAITAALMALAALGVALPPPVPTGMALDAGAHGTFDHEVFASASLVVVGPLALYAAANVTSAGARAAAMVAALVIYLGLGIGSAALSIVGVATLLLGLALSLPHLKGRAGSVAVWAATMGAVVAIVIGRFGLEPPDPPRADDDGSIPLMADDVFETFRLGGPENAITSAAEWGFAWSQAMAIFEQARLLGEGVGSYPYYVGLAVDAEHPYYTEPRDEYHLHQSPPGLVAGLGSELGLVGLGLGLLFVVLVALSTLVGAARPDPRQAPGGGYLVAAAAAALVVLLGTPAAWHAGEGVAVFAALGLAVRLQDPVDDRGVASTRTVGPTSGSFGRFERWVMVGAPLLILLAFGAWRTASATANDYLRQRGELYLMAGQHDAAIDAFEAAVAFEPEDYRSHYYLGLAQYYTPTDEERRAAAREHIAEAARLWPFDARVQLQAIKNQLQRGGLELMDRLEAAGSVRNELLELRRRDPRNIEVHRQLGDVQKALGNYDQAVAALLEVTQLTGDTSTLRRVHEEIADLFAEHLDDPEHALEHYRRALDNTPSRGPLAEGLLQRIGFVEEWIRRGSRPAAETGHGGSDHDHDHDHGGEAPPGPGPPPPPPAPSPRGPAPGDRPGGEAPPADSSPPSTSEE